MTAKMIFVLGLLAVVGLGNAQLTQDGQCGTLNTMTGFVLNSFVGTWYELGKSSSNNADCSTLQFTSANGVISVSNPSVVNNFLQSSTGTATQTTGTAIFTLTLSASATPFEFRILNTDYTNYAVAYNCENLSATQRSVNIWLLGRQTTSLNTAAILTLANAALESLGTTVAQLPSIDHSTDACTLLPTILPGQPIILDGLCNTTVPVVQNFSVADFVGTWHEISSYYSANQLGTCARADYTLVGSTVNVVNSQVLNQRLDTVSGTATLIGTNGEGRLNVILDVQGIQISQELLIIDTDYSGYAVSYSCSNLDNNQRRVQSWILSRDREISAASQTEVTRVLSTFLDLNAEYYQPTLQTDAACFYYPIFQPGVPVMFPGQCNSGLLVQANFTPEAYVGLWHDIESYPSVFQQGTCNNAFYTLTPAGTVDVFNTEVVNQTLSTINGVAIIPDPTQPAKLLVSFPIEGTNLTASTDYWVMSTDYTSYSLVYTCVDLPNNERTVFSWKLSRTKALTALANQAINEVMATIDVLDSQYFAERDQSRAGCFYYPEAVPGARVVFPGQCEDTVTAVPNFNFTQFAGTWHEVEAYPKENQAGTCINHEFTTATAANTLNLVSNQVIDERLTSSSGNIVLESTDGSGRLRLNMTVDGQVISFPYWVLDTDYNNYALIYSCENIDDDFRSVHSWKLSRIQTLTEASNTAINTAMAPVVVLENVYYESVGQTNNDCFYYPIFQPGVPVMFPGQCNANLTVQANFNPEAYVGLWHDIESYPSVFQQGTCNNAFYTLTPAGTVDVFNTEVVNQTLSTINGVAIIPDPTQPAKLLVSFPIEGTNLTASTDYWVMSTDYTSYSLVYTCVDLPNNERTVFSWKLSRTKALTALANQAINEVMATIDVLDSQYFAERDQSRAGCFYYPEAVPGARVVFPGQCEDTVTAVPNFNFTQFAGTWYEVEAYPKENQTGTCVNHEFTTATAANTLNLVSSQVVDERPTSSVGNVVLESTDGSGRLRLTMTVNGQLISIPYWVLDTDYNSYALIYSCENIDDDFRSVHSWKLSRTQTLTAAANTAINAAMAPVVVLENVYYESVGQTTNDCFYYPIFEGTPESIILSGSCPPISGKANFVPADYLGHWFEVASYPIPSQNGTCSRSEYTLVDGVITIRNTMVVDRQLQTQMGIARLSSTGTGLLTVTFVLENGEEVVSTYYILETDYTSFSLVYNCVNVGENRRVTSWKLSRTPTLTANATNIIDGIVTSTQGLLEDYYQSTSQTAADCFYVPELQPEQDVLFRGPCEAVTPITGFNVNQYLGWWHEIERYPTDAETGQCSSAEFRQSGNIFQVVEASVDGGSVNETTSNVVINSNGTITIARPEGPAVWHVLATDYNTYSLLYSCETVPTVWGDYRKVWSAKHSKARSLTAAAQNAMNPIIAANDLLYAHFYEQVNQSASACFHYREEAGEQVILDGQCDTEIPVQSNFDASLFAGTWYQMERYPYPQVDNAGTCVGSRYTVDGNSVSVLNWEVLNGNLNQIEGTATVDASTATLTVTLPVAGSDETSTTQLRVLLTDYDDYALAYTCVNVNLYQRAIGAFKLSRSRQLSNAGSSAIETFMATREELHQPYFLAISHNEDCLEPSSALLVKSSIIIMVACILLQLVM